MIPSAGCSIMMRRATSAIVGSARLAGARTRGSISSTKAATPDSRTARIEASRLARAASLSGSARVSSSARPRTRSRWRRQKANVI